MGKGIFPPKPIKSWPGNNWRRCRLFLLRQNLCQLFYLSREIHMKEAKEEFRNSEAMAQKRLAILMKRSIEHNKKPPKGF